MYFKEKREECNVGSKSEYRTIVQILITIYLLVTLHPIASFVRIAFTPIFFIDPQELHIGI
ncbi:MAG: hypothetical protein DRJ49_05415 [Thermoprotei archaeon]|nr:MAG: hypothetical protein DRN53_07765 [Thermoprotei archaeon]RLE88162.1 MAG: hypothetical protein DRJ49_05415 [Thermoprotei archaeon]